MNPDYDEFQLPFPWWNYLNQSLCDANHPLILNPVRFWKRYQMEFLEQCFTWHERSVLLLERCWQLNSEANLPSKRN
jgi:hypothetical protein